MSDLESDNESIVNLSDDEENTQPTFTIKPSAKKSDEKLKEYDEEGNVIADYNDDDEDGDIESDINPEIDEDEDEDVDEDEDEDVDEDEDEEFGDIENPDISTSKKKISKKTSSKPIDTLPDTQLEIPNVFDKNEDDYDSDTDEEEDEDYLQKFDKEIRDNYILNEHPESLIHNYDEIYNLAKVQRNKENIIIDDLHKTIPILTKYKKTKILGLRAKQLNNGATPYTRLKSTVIDGYLIAIKELEEKKIPFIVRRPMPNGGSEYWHLQDLEII